IKPGIYHFQHKRLIKRSINPSLHYHKKLTQEPAGPNSRSSSGGRRDADDDVEVVLSDPKWPSMWYLNRGGDLDMNVERAWKHSVTGKGVVVTILDDGLEKDHPDLIKNYDPHASYDVNGRDPDPMPRYDLIDSNRHGTRCAGEVAADANNSICAVGVAYEASVGGVRMLDGDVTDAVEAKSIALNPQHIDIYSASWGPDDDGKTVDGPGQLATRAFIEGVSRGRNGKGSIFVWASGNGGRDEDNCNCDEKGAVPWYSEACSSTLATTYSSGALGERQIVTTDLHHGCTTSHTGTSASAPLAAGICALALHANMDLTWRDMQHVVVRTARPENLNAPDWQTNGVGRKVSHRLIPQKSYVTLTLEVSDCPGVNYLEHVQSKVTLIADRRGDIQIFLVSPAGTRSNLLAPRHRDNSRTGFHSWPFMTVHMWGESPLGIWKLEIHNNGIYYSQNKATIQNWTLIFHGTEVEPGQPVDLLHPLSGNSIVDHGSSSHSTHREGGRTEEREKEDSSRDQEPRNPLQQELGEAARSSGSPTPTPMSIFSPKGGTRKSSLPNLLPGCASMGTIGNCLDCSAGFVLLEGKCFSNCLEGFYQENSTEGDKTISCEKCHYSCRTCSGPFDYHCSSCWPDALLYKQQNDEKYCHSKSIVEAYERSSSWITVILSVFFILFCFIVTLSFIVWRNRRLPQDDHQPLTDVQIDTQSNGLSTKFSKNKRKISYTPIAADDSDKLMSKIPFHDLTSEEEEEDT
ncbi:Furin-like protease 1, isoform 1-CRR, partial [Armadillidium nasatum]